MEARKTEIATWDCIECDIERVGEDWQEMIARMYWSLIREN